MRTLIFIACIIFSIASSAQQKIDAKFPKATIAGKSAGEITIQEIITAGELKTTDPEFKITHFAFTLKSGNDLVTVTNNSNKITDQMIGLVQKMKSGQKLVVEQIETLHSEGKTIQFEMLIFFIK